MSVNVQRSHRLSALCGKADRLFKREATRALGSKRYGVALRRWSSLASALMRCNAGKD